MSKELAGKLLDPLQKQQELLAALKLELQTQLQALKTQELILMTNDHQHHKEQDDDQLFQNLPIHTQQPTQESTSSKALDQIQLEDLFTFNTLAEDDEAFLQQLQSDPATS